QGLHAVRLNGCTHGDVKPQNLLMHLCRDGTVEGKICDFGSIV
ncbi:unnamed protein product, partial [Discosporangium mesarthrocarpum]